MEIELSMLDFWKLPHTLQEKLVGKYLEYPKNNKETEFVIERHEIGDSQHFDWRNSVNGYLIGWSIVGFSKDKPADVKVLLDNIGKGFRAETKCYSEICNEWKFDIYEKNGEYYYNEAGRPHLLSIEELARQPKVWLFKKMPIGKRFTFKPGEVGAGVEKPGHMTVLTRGKVKFGCQKVWFHEYFLKDNKYFKDWTRVIVRAVRAGRLEPRTKRPIPGQFERFWRFMIPKDQTPYAISRRAIKEKWKPPRNIVPFPKEWARKNFPKKLEKWKEYMKIKELSGGINYTLALHKYRGPIHIRGMWRLDWYLFLDDKGKGKVRTFNLKGDPVREKVIETWYEGRDSRKYLTWEGKTRPMSRFNPNEKLYGEMKILERNKVIYETIIEDGEEKIQLDFKGKLLKGKWELVQEERGSEAYVFRKSKVKLSLLNKEEYEFGYYRHYWDNKSHHDLRWKTSDTSKEEFNIYGNLLEAEIELPIKAVHKTFKESKKEVDYWMLKEGTRIPRKIGKLETFVDVIDYGKLYIIERNPQFISMVLKGKKFKNTYVVAKKNKEWIISKSRLPKALSKEGNPRTGNYFKPFIVEQKKNWDYFIVHIYDIRNFTRCESKEKVKKYLPGKIPAGVSVGVCLYPVPGQIHNARVAYVRFSLKNWSPEKAINWIKENKLEEFSRKQIRGV